MPSKPYPSNTSEQERRALIRKWENLPSPNPEFRGSHRGKWHENCLKFVREGSAY